MFHIKSHLGVLYTPFRPLWLGASLIVKPDRQIPTICCKIFTALRHPLYERGHCNIVASIPCSLEWHDSHIQDIHGPIECGSEHVLFSTTCQTYNALLCYSCKILQGPSVAGWEDRSFRWRTWSLEALSASIMTAPSLDISMTKLKKKLDGGISRLSFLQFHFWLNIHSHNCLPLKPSPFDKWTFLRFPIRCIVYVVSPGSLCSTFYYNK